MEPMINIALRAARKAGENIVRASDDLDRVDVVAKGVNSTGTANAGLLAGIARVAILLLAGSMALNHMGLANEIINTAFSLLLGAVAVAVAIAFGLGGREAAAQLLDQWRKDWPDK